MAGVLLRFIAASAVMCSLTESLISYSQDIDNKDTMEALNAVLRASYQRNIFTMFITDKQQTLGDVHKVAASWGVGMFELQSDDQLGNMTQGHLGQSTELNNIYQLCKVSQYVTMVVASDDPAFLATFTQWSLMSRLLVWSTRLLVLTRLPLHRLQHLRYTLSMTNSMVLQMNDKQYIRCGVYMELPYNIHGAKTVQIAKCGKEQGFIFTNSMPLFPEKFNKLSEGPQLRVAMVIRPAFNTSVIDDPDAPGGKRIYISTAHTRVLDRVAKAMNFTIRYVMAADQEYGRRLSNGSWTGKIGMLVKDEADIGLGKFLNTESRAKAVDLTNPLVILGNRLIASGGQREADPWGFLLPLGPLVWVAILMSLLGILVVMMLLPSCLNSGSLSRGTLITNIDSCIRVLLQQDVRGVIDWSWSERVLMGVWMLTMLVLTRSYASNLMSLLAVRHIPMPIQSLQDILDNPITLLIPKGSAQSTAFLTATFGVMRDITNLKNGLQTFKGSEYLNKVRTDVRGGGYVLLASSDHLEIMMANYYSETGKCDFYLGRQQILSTPQSMAVQKGSPLLGPINRRLMDAAEFGIDFLYYLPRFTANYTTCLNPRSTEIVNAKIGLTNTWGMFVVLVGGGMTSAFILCLELLVKGLYQPTTTSSTTSGSRALRSL